MTCRVVEYGESLRQIGLGPPGKLWSLCLPALDGLIEQALGLGFIGGIEDGTNAPSGLLAHIKTGHVGMRVLLQMELATLPRHTG